MKLLVIEDDNSIRDFLKRALEADSFVVHTTVDGEQGSYMARTSDYDLVIVDETLPGKLGHEICREIREKGKKMPIIALSVHTEVPVKLSFFENGADDYLTKPFSYSELLARIKALLRRPTDLGSSVLQIDNLILNIDDQTVTRGGKEIYLTRKEYMLLDFMLRNKGKVVSKGVIIEHVWDRESSLLSNTLETHILNLRKKIDFADNPKLIHTIPGRGYKIELKL